MSHLIDTFLLAFASRKVFFCAIRLGNEPPLEELKDRYYDFRNCVADFLQAPSEDLDDLEAFEEHYDDVMDLKETNDIIFHVFESAYQIACGKLDTDDDFY